MRVCESGLHVQRLPMRQLAIGHRLLAGPKHGTGVPTETTARRRGQRHRAEVPAATRYGPWPTRTCAGMRAVDALHLPPSIHPSLHLSKNFTRVFMEVGYLYLALNLQQSDPTLDPAIGDGLLRVQHPGGFGNFQESGWAAASCSHPLEPLNANRHRMPVSFPRTRPPAAGPCGLAPTISIEPSENPPKGACCFMSVNYSRARAGPGLGPKPPLRRQPCQLPGRLWASGWRSVRGAPFWNFSGALDCHPVPIRSHKSVARGATRVFVGFDAGAIEPKVDL